MASNDKLWFDLGVRDNVSKVLNEILSKAEELQDTIAGISISKDAVKNASDIEKALDKIYVARQRIAESKGLASSAEDKKMLKDMDKQLAKMQKTFESFSKVDNDLSKAAMGTKGWAKFMETVHNLPLAIDQVRRKTGEINAEAIERERQEEREAARVDSLKDKYYELYRIRKQLQDAVMNAPAGVDVSNAVSMINSLSGRMGAIRNAERTGAGMPLGAEGADASEFCRRVREETKNLTAATDDYNKKLTTTKDIQVALQRMKLDTESQQRIAGIRKQIVEYNALENKIREINNLINLVHADELRVRGGGPQTITRDYITSELDAIQRRYNEDLARGRQLEREDAEAMSQNAAAAKRKTEAIQMLAHVNQSLISSYNRIAEAGSKANRITIQLQNQIAGYAGLYGLERLAKSVITIGGQFEFQHIALQNILGDVQQANTLFEQLQSLAVESPKTFMELTSYTKQLSAYQIPYEELYDTTKRLADISTGLGVDMGRLILAYGQVRSAAVLRGQELRQFTEAGIPLVQKLAEKFTELNGKAVTTGEVFELISKRAVPFKMVQEIMWDMTNEGGQFFDMQGKLADTLYGKYQKLQDSWQIMLGRIADGEGISGSFFKVTVEGLVSILSVLDKIMPVLGTMAVGKFGRSLLGKIGGTYNDFTGRTAVKNMENAKTREAARLERERLMYGRQLTQVEQELINKKNILTANELKLLTIEGKITERQVAQLANAGRLDVLESNRYLHARGYTVEQIKQIRNGNLQIIQNGESAMKRLGNGALNFVGGGWGVAAAAVGGAIALYQRGQEQAEKASQLAESAANAALSSLQKVNAEYVKLSSERPTNSEEMSAANDRMINLLKNSGNYTEETKKQVEATDDLSERYAILFGKMEQVSNEYLRMKENVKAYLAEANKVGQGNWFQRMFVDSMAEDLQDWSEKQINVRVTRRGLERSSALMKTELKEYYAELGRWNQEEMGQLRWDTLFERLSDSERTNFKLRLSRKAGSYGITDEEEEMYKKAAGAVNEYIGAINSLRSAEREVDGQSAKYIDTIQVALEDLLKAQGIKWEDIGKSDENLIKFRDAVNDIINSYNLDAETAEKFRNKIYNGLLGKSLVARIKALIIPEKSGLTEWQQELDKYFKEHPIAGITIDAQTSLEKLEKDLQNKKKELQEQMDRGKGILIKFGADFSDLEKSVKALMEKNYLFKWLINKAFTDYTTGKSGIEQVDKTKELGLNVDGKTKKTGSGKKADEELKRLRTRIKEIQEFWREYEELAQRMSDSDAVNEIRKSGIFPSLFDKNGKLAFDVRGGIVNAIDAAMKGFNASTEERKQYAVEVGKIKFNVTQKAIKEALEEAEKDVQEYLSKQTEQWNLYRTLFEKTGDRDFAMNAFRDGMVWDDLSHQFADDLRVAIEGAGKNLNVNKLLGMTEEQAKEALKGVEGGYALWKKTSDLVRKNYNKALNDGVAAMEKQYDITEKIRIEQERIAELERQRNNTTDPAVRRSLGAEILNHQKNLDNLEYEKFKQSSEYVQFFGSILTMADDTMERTAQTIRDRLIVELSRGNISAHQYAKALKDVSTQLEKGRTAFKGPKGAFFDGGIKGLVEYREQEVANAARRVEEARKELEELQKRKEKGEEISKIDEEAAKERLQLALQMLGRTQNLSEGMQKFAGVAAKAGKALAIIKGAFDGFAQVGQSIAETLRAYGDDSTASDWQTMADSFNAMGQAISPLQDVLQSAMNGNISGIISGVISAPVKMITGPMTAFAKMHDAALQEEIEASQARQKEMETLFENMEKVLGRVLGGVYEFSRSENSKAFRDEFNKEALKRIAFDSIYQKYKDSRGLNGVTGAILKGLAGSDTTVGYFKTAAKTQEYYDMQRALLAAQQQELQRQLSAEEDKKDSDANAIAGYKQQIKDLEDQIQFFAMDMAKALYDIDLQSWASELTDAVVSAWENGEDAAEAYTNKVKGLMKDLTKNILAKKVMEKAFEQASIDSIITRMMDATSGKLDYTLIPELSKALAQAGQNSTDIITRVLDELERQGYIDKGEGSGGGSVTSGIKAITENTADLLASYINAIRADVSVNRGTLQQILLAVQSQAQMPVIAQAQLQQLQNIAANTGRNAQAAEDILRILNLATIDASHGFHVN